MKKIYRICQAAFVATVLTACADYDNGFEQKKMEYEKNFKELFGDIDPNQDWNMAKQYKATVDLGENVNGTLKIYTDAPHTYGSELLAKTTIEDGKGNVYFDAVKNSAMFYVRLESNEGRVIKSGYYASEDDALNIINNKRRKVKKGGTVTETLSNFTWSVAKMPTDDVNAFWNGNKDSYDALSISIWNKNTNVISVPNISVINNLDYGIHDEGYTVDELKPIFNTYISKDGATKGGVFEEGKDHIKEYVQTGILDPDVTFSVKETGHVELDVIWRGTQYYDRFGYYFYDPNTYPNLTPEQWFNDVKKIVLIDQPSGATLTKGMIGSTSSLTQYSKYEDGVYKTPVDMDGMACTNNIGSLNGKDKIIGTKLTLIYVDPTTGDLSYDFPEGTKIGFFLCHDKENPQYNFFVSDTKTDYALFAHQNNETSYITVQHWKNRPFAAKFNYDGRTYVGFGDQSGDKDLNDIVLIADNVWPPAYDLTPQDLYEAGAKDWLIACEDLGTTDDVDFNDVVFKVSHVGGEKKLSVTPLAAGGSLGSDLYYGDPAHGGKLIGEIHQLFGEASAETGDYSFINTTSGRSRKGRVVTIGGENCTITADVPSDYSLASQTIGEDDFNSESSVSMGNFYIVTHQIGTDATATTISQPTTGEAPQMICLPYMYKRPSSISGKVEIGEWAWPSERTSIGEAYNVEGHRFTDWVGNTSSKDWYNYASGKVVKGSYAVVNGSMDSDDIIPTPDQSKPDVPFSIKKDGVEIATYNVYSFSNTIDITDIGLDGVVDKNSVRATSSSPDVVEVINPSTYAYNTALKVKSVGDATITVTHLGTADYATTSKTFTVHVVDTARPSEGEQGGGGSQITPSGTTTFTGDALAALLDNGNYVIPASVCQTKTSCTVTFQFTPSGDDGFVQIDAWTLGDNDWTWLQLFNGQSATQMQMTGMESNKDYDYTVKSDVFKYINKNGMKLRIDYGTIISITIDAK